jgi:hypothetical protein
MESQKNIDNQNQPDRISMKMIWRSILQEFNLEKGILHTVVDLALRPGQTIKEYLYEDRSKLVPPFRFLLIFVTLGTIVTLSFLTQEDLINSFQQGSKQVAVRPISITWTLKKKSSLIFTSTTWPLLISSFLTFI